MQAFSQKRPGEVVVDDEDTQSKRAKMEGTGDLQVVTVDQVLTGRAWGKLSWERPLCTILPSRGDVIEAHIKAGIRQVDRLTQAGDEYLRQAVGYVKRVSQRGQAAVRPINKHSQVTEDLVNELCLVEEVYQVETGQGNVVHS